MSSDFRQLTATLNSAAKVRGLERCGLAALLVTALAAQGASAAPGRTEGALEVSGQGAASYSVPLVVPPGVNGLTPKLALTYASTAPNGLLGVGWGVSGLSAITRCPRTIAQHGARRAIQLDGDDRYCLDGNVLRAVSGAYGAAGTEYRTELETYSRIKGSGSAGAGPASFIVERKDGTKLTYGNWSDSQIESLGSTNNRAWLLSVIADRSGNAIYIRYYEDVVNGSYRPREITWNNRNGGSDGLYKIEFFYETRPDMLVGYVSGGLVRETQRLNRVDVTYNTSTVVRRYWLSYDTSIASSRSRIATIQECGLGGDCVSPTTLTYHPGAAAYSSTISTQPLGFNGDFGTATPGDFNGDGRADLIFVSDVVASSGPTYKAYYVLGNASGGFDGPYDSGFECLANLEGGGYWFCSFVTLDSDGDGRTEIAASTASEYLSGPYEIGVAGSTFAAIGTSLNGYVPFDYDGDGRDDTAVVGTGGIGCPAGMKICVYPATSGAAMDVYTAPAGEALVGETLWASNNGQRFAAPLDFNADGRADLVIATAPTPFPNSLPHNVRVLLASSAGFVQGATFQFSPSSSANFQSGLVPLDANGDGCVDLLQIISPAARLHLSNCGRAGSSSILEAYTTTPIALTPNQYYNPRQFVVADWDGDGMQDILVDNQVYRSTGTNLASAVPNGAPTNTYNPPSPYSVAASGDFNGDGQADLLYGLAPNIAWVPHSGATIPDLVNVVSDGFGVTTTVAHGPTTNSSVHNQYPASYPFQAMTRPQYVVSGVTRNDSNGSNWSEQLYYYGGAIELTGRGSAGFASVYRYDGRTGLRRYDNYVQAYPYTGTAYHSSVYSSDWTLVRLELTQMNDVAYSSGTELRQFPYRQSYTRHDYELGGSLNGVHTRQEQTVVNVIDATSGTPTTLTVTTTEPTGSNGVSGGRVYTAQAVTSLFNDTTNWCLGRASSTQQTNSHTGSHGAAQTRTNGATWDGYYCRPTQTVTEPGNATMAVTVTPGYDAFGNVNSELIAPAGMTSRTRLKSFGTSGFNPESLTNEIGEQTQQQWEPARGLLLSQSDPNGLVTARQYDSMGRKTRETRPDGTYTNWDWYYCASGCDPRVRMYVSINEYGIGGGWLGQTVDYFDKFDQPLVSYRWSSMLGAASYSLTGRWYDSVGRVTAEYFPFLNGAASTPYESMGYDALGRVSSRTRPVSASDSTPQVSTTAYVGRTTVFTDAEGKTSAQVTDVLGNVVRSVDGAGYYVESEFDAFGNPRRASDSAGVTLQTADFNVRGFPTARTDSDLGSWGFAPDALGQLTARTDAKGLTLTFTYDLLGRKTSQTMPGAGGTTTSTWSWGNVGMNTATNKYAGALYYSAISGGGVTSWTETHVRDALARPVLTQVNAGGEIFNDNRGYHPSNGQLEVLVLPESAAIPGFRLALKYEYSHKELARISYYDNPSTVFWQANVYDARFNVIDESFYSGVRTLRNIDRVTGWTTNVQSGPGANNAFQNLEYAYFRNGNLKYRRDINRNLWEQFTYDAVNRLDYSTLNGVTNLDVNYTANGNIDSKSGVGTYLYTGTMSGCTAQSAPMPHAVRRAGGTDYCYDANGNIASRGGNAVAWYSNNLPKSMNGPGGITSAFEYGPDGQYWRQTATYGTGPETTTYVGGVFEKVVGSTVTAYRNYIKAGDRTVGIWTYRSNNDHVGYHPLTDHLGSTDAVSNHVGQMVSYQSFEGFGKRRDAADWDGPTAPADDVAIANTGRRGYTGHTMLDNLSMVHMNGRVFDPVIGRFVSADPNIDGELNPQGWNRYSYVKNNPLSAWDPTGFDTVGVDQQLGYSPKAASGRRRSKVDGGCEVASPTCTSYGTDAPRIVRSAVAPQVQLPQGNPLTQDLTRDLNDYAENVTKGRWWDAIKSLFTMNKNVWKNSYSTKEGAVLTTMSMIPFVGFETTVFKTGHYAARLGDAGLDIARTEAAVGTALNSVRADIAVMADVRGRMVVDGVLVEYGARVLPNGTLHIGTIFPVK